MQRERKTYAILITLLQNIYCNMVKLCFVLGGFSKGDSYSTVSSRCMPLCVMWEISVTDQLLTGCS